MLHVFAFLSTKELMDELTWHWMYIIWGLKSIYLRQNKVSVDAGV